VLNDIVRKEKKGGASLIIKGGRKGKSPFFTRKEEREKIIIPEGTGFMEKTEEKREIFSFSERERRSATFVHSRERKG